eukprot:186974-Prorocentrum_minimum.AAC.6
MLGSLCSATQVLFRSSRISPESSPSHAPRIETSSLAQLRSVACPPWWVRSSSSGPRVLGRARAGLHYRSSRKTRS